jgi:hypothetical protein
VFAVYDAPPGAPLPFGEGVQVVEATTVQRVAPVTLR